MRAGARSIGANVADRVKSTLGGGGSAKNANVWETATTEAPGDEPPECQWCPICRAARRYRDSGGTPAGAGSPLAGVGDTLAGFTRDAFGLFEAAMRPAPPRPPAGYYPTAGAQPASTPTTGTPTTSTPPADTPPASAPSPGQPSDNGTVVGPGVGWPTVVHPKHEDDEATHEGGDREEGGERGNGAADGGADEQVERTAE
jgi:DNA polymerase III subunit gamma/tau